MLESELMQAGVVGGPRPVQQWRVTLSQGHGLQMIAIEGQQFTVAPHAALIDDFVRSAALPPGLLPLLGSHPAVAENHLEQSTTLPAVVDWFINSEVRPATSLEAGQLG